MVQISHFPQQWPLENPLLNYQIAPITRLIMYHLNAFGQSKYYVDNLAQNVRRGMKHKAKLGIWPMLAPVGYINDTSTKTIQIDSETSKILRKGFEIFAEGGKSFTEIALYLHKFGIPKSKRPFKPDTMKRILINKFYMGIMKYDGEYYQGSHKLFISKKLFDAVQKQVDKIERPRRNGHDFAFVGLARCGECKASITAEQHTKNYPSTRGKVTYIHYRCTKKLGPCSQKYLSEPEMEEQVREIIKKCGIHESHEPLLEKWINEEAQNDQKMAEENILKLKTQAESVDKKLNLLLDSFLGQVIDNETYKNKKNELFEEKLRITEQIEKIKHIGSVWLEPMKEWVGSALSCAKIARAKNTNHDLGNLVKTVGSNLILVEQRLQIKLDYAFLALQTSGDDWSAPAHGTLTSYQVSVYRQIRTHFLSTH